MESVDLHVQLLSVRDKQKDVLKEVHHILSKTQTTNVFDPDQLEVNRVFHLDQIRKICIDYRLRFLDINRFKGVIPEEAHNQQRRIEKSHQTQLNNLKIMAPSKLFKLDSADDPLLFAPMGNGYYYLIHKWGNDMNPFRKWMVWPFKNILTICVSLLLISLMVTFLMPLGLFNPNPTISDFLLVFLFVFKSIASVVIFYGFALGKNFNRAIWDSKYYKS